MKARNIAYWVTTVLFGLGMAVGGVFDLLRVQAAIEIIQHLGYPIYLLTIIGVAKPLGSLVVLAPRFPRLKEWAYAGLMIDLIGATSSHAFTGDSPKDICIPIVFMVIGMTSYFLRPESRRLPG